MNPHDYVWFALVIITIILAVLAVFGFLLLIEKSAEIAFVSLYVIGFVLMGLWFGAAPNHKVVSFTTPYTAKVTRLDTSIILTINDKPIMTVTDVSTYNQLRDKTNVTLYRHEWLTIFNSTNADNKYILNPQ